MYDFQLTLSELLYISQAFLSFVLSWVKKKKIIYLIPYQFSEIYKCLCFVSL